MLDVMADYENNRDMLSKMTEVYQLDYEVCRDILMRSLLLLIGIGTMICDGRMDFSDEQVMTMMKFSDGDIYSLLFRIQSAHLLFISRQEELTFEKDVITSNQKADRLRSIILQEAVSKVQLVV